MIFCYLCRFRNMGINIGSHAVNEEIIMEITDNIIISEANEFPHSLMQPFVLTLSESLFVNKGCSVSV